MFVIVRLYNIAAHSDFEPLVDSVEKLVILCYVHYLCCFGFTKS